MLINFSQHSRLTENSLLAYFSSKIAHASINRGIVLVYRKVALFKVVAKQQNVCDQNQSYSSELQKHFFFHYFI